MRLHCYFILNFAFLLPIPIPTTGFSAHRLSRQQNRQHQHTQNFGMNNKLTNNTDIPTNNAFTVVGNTIYIDDDDSVEVIKVVKSTASVAKGRHRHACAAATAATTATGDNNNQSTFQTKQNRTMKSSRLNPKDHTDTVAANKSIAQRQLIILVGIPGCGKSFFAEQLVSSDPRYVRINQDQLKTRKKCVSGEKKENGT